MITKRKLNEGVAHFLRGATKSLIKKQRQVYRGQKSSSVLKQADLLAFLKLFYFVMRNLGLIKAIFGAVLGFECTFFKWRPRLLL